MAPCSVGPAGCRNAGCRGTPRGLGVPSVTKPGCTQQQGSWAGEQWWQGWQGPGATRLQCQHPRGGLIACPQLSRALLRGPAHARAKPLPTPTPALCHADLAGAG